MLTKKHFEKIAKAIKDGVENQRCLTSNHFEKDEKTAVGEAIAEEIAKVFSQENPNFNRERFIKACGV